MKSNKGFTLVELLAVIVILAIIALIATPAILNVIDKARKGAAESSALGYVDAVEKQIMINQLDSVNIPEGTYSVDSLTKFGVEVKGEKPAADTSFVKIDNKGEVEKAELVVSDFNVTYEEVSGKKKATASKEAFGSSKLSASHACSLSDNKITCAAK